MTTLAEIAANIEAKAAIEAAQAEAIAAAEQADIERGLTTLYDLRTQLGEKLGSQLRLLRTVMAGGNVLSSALEEIETLEDVELTIDEIENLICEAQDALAEHRLIDLTMKSGDYTTYSEGCICGMCGADEDDFAGSENVDPPSDEEPIDHAAVGAALQNAVVNGTITPYGGPQDIVVDGRTLRVVPLGVANSPSEVGDILAKLAAGGSLN